MVYVLNVQDTPKFTCIQSAYLNTLTIEACHVLARVDIILFSLVHVLVLSPPSQPEWPVVCDSDGRLSQSRLARRGVRLSFQSIQVPHVHN